MAQYLFLGDSGRYIHEYLYMHTHPTSRKAVTGTIGRYRYLGTRLLEAVDMYGEVGCGT